MLLSEFKDKLKTVTEVIFLKPDGTSVPRHFHITEVGQINKRFIDCGGTVRNENVISMQLWESVDVWHKLEPSKLSAVINLSETKLAIENHPIEIEYQSDTIGKYGIEFINGSFKLTTTHTTCLAIDKCGIPFPEKVKEVIQSCCPPSAGCC